MARRDYKTGSVYQRASDWRWVATVEAGWTTEGVRRRVTVSGPGCTGGCKARCQHRTEIKNRLRDKKATIAESGVPVPKAGRTTVKSWAEEWLTITQRTLRPKPWATDASSVKQWIIPTIGHRRIDELTPRDLRAVGDAQRSAGRTTSTMRRTHLTMTSMLRAAIVEGHAVPRRVLDVKAPPLSASDRTNMPIPEALAVLHEASFLPHGSRWAMAFFGGVRQAECLGLTEECLDLDRAMAVVEWQLQPLPYIDYRNKQLGFRIPDGYEVRHLVGQYHLTRPKTKRGFRVIPLIPALHEALTDWLPIRPANPWGLVWPTLDGKPCDAKEDRLEWYALQGSAGVGHPAGRYYKVHEARHATATQMLEENVDPKIITDVLGHSSILTSRGYMHTSHSKALAALTAAMQPLALPSAAHASAVDA